ncbi:MAG: hypothetical protein HUJ98_09690, partial [Bacteroidaceae bacterium]|nr:hypothetical protein [Bacteroidaceae bacterium]
SLQKKQSFTTGKVIELTSQDLLTENTVDAPHRVRPVEQNIAVNGSVLETKIPAHSFRVYILK